MASKAKAQVDLKFVVVGDGAVGKTCLLQAFSTEEEINKDHVPTIFENSQKDHKYKNQSYSLDLWDTAGQENFDRLRPLSYKGVDCFLLCFDVSNATSLDNIKFKWMKEIQQAIQDNVSNSDDSKGQVMLVGTKSDKRGMKSDIYKEVTSDQIAEHRRKIAENRGYGENEDAVPYVETCALTRKNVKEVFETAIELCMHDSKPKASGCCTIL